MKLYCLSGLGVDQRAFKNLVPKDVILIHIPWIDPLKNERLKAYSIRLFNKVNPEQDYSIVGVSFGGMITAEFAKIQTPKNLYFISTIPSKNDLRGLFKFGAALKLHKLLPTSFLTRANFLTFYFFGIKSAEGKKLIREILRDTDPKFMQWAINAIVRWDNKIHLNGIVIHGTKDRILPRKVSIDYSIRNAGHFMIVTQGAEITKIIEATYLV